MNFLNIQNNLTHSINYTNSGKALFEKDIYFLEFEFFAIISCVFMLVFFAWLSNSKNKKKNYIYATDYLINSIIISSLILIIILNYSAETTYTALNGYYVSDKFSFFFKNVSLILFIMYAFVLKTTANDAKIDFEFILLIYISFISGLFLINVNDLFLLFLILEAQTLCFYVLVSSKQTSSFSTEAGLKYFILGSFSAGIILFGISLIYGFSGLLGYSDLSLFLSGMVNSGLSIFDSNVFCGFMLGFYFVLFGLLFKLGAAPFHTWMPDVYEGSPIVITSYLATVAKLPIVFIFLKIIFHVMQPVFHLVQPFLIASAIMSLIIGSFGAIYQLKIKRLLTYSMITNTGYILLCVSFGGIYAIWATVFYLVSYLIALIGIFFCLSALKTHHKGLVVRKVTALANLAEVNPTLAFCIFILFFSLAGIPPLMGFYGKFSLFLFSINYKMYAISILVVVLSAISVFYYIRVAKLMYFNRSRGRVFYKQIPFSHAYIISLCTLSNIFFFICPDVLFNIIHYISLTFFL